MTDLKKCKAKGTHGSCLSRFTTYDSLISVAVDGFGDWGRLRFVLRRKGMIGF